MEPEIAKDESPKTSAATPKDDFVRKWEAQAKEWDAELSVLAARAEKTSAAAKAEFHKWQRDFHGKRLEAQAKLESLRTANHEAWESVKTGADAAWTDVKKAFESAKDKFK